VDGRQITRSLHDAAVRRGVTWVQANVERLAISNNRVGGAVVDGEQVAAQAVVITGGAWTAHFADQLGVPVGVRPQRGQIVHLGTPEQDTQRWPILHTLRGYYLVPWPDQRVAVGATREDGAGFDPSMTVAGIEEVFTEAERMVPMLHDATLCEIRVGLRPSSLDGLPILGRVPHVDGVVLATGHGPVGLTHGPYTGKLITDLLLDRSIEVDLAPFSAGRSAT
jgi:D-amino-acid dehydrogenase